MSATRSAPIDLAHLLSPVSSESFFSESWETQSLLVERNNEDHYAGLLSMRDVDQMIAFSHPQFTDPGAFEDAAPVRSTYVRGLPVDRPVTPRFKPGIAELRQVFDRGKSVVIMGVQQRWPSVAALSRNLESVFHCPIHANMYLTPAGSQGFSAHYDPHDVFILQLEGTKHWRLYERVELLPLASDTVGAPARPLGAAREICLRPGDLLYIPRGHVHDAHTADSYSLHLTVGINVYRWADLIHHAVECASRREPRFRRSLPGGALPDASLLHGPQGLKQQFKDLLASLSDGSIGDQLFDEASDTMTAQFYGQMSMLPGSQFSSRIDLEQIGLDTILERQSQAMCRVMENAEGVAVLFPGNRVAGPHRIASALRFVAATTRFAVKDLPDDLSAQAKLVLSRRLIREGLLTPVEGSSSSRSHDGQSAEEAPAHCPAVPVSEFRAAKFGGMPPRKVQGTARQMQEREVVER